MKKLLILCMLSLLAGNSWSQQEYVWAHANNPDYEPGYISDAILYNGRLYHVYDSNSNYLNISIYDPANSTWTTLVSDLNPNYEYRIQARLVGSKIYIVAQGTSSYELFSYDIPTNDLVDIVNLPASMPGSNWEFITGPTDDDLYLLHVTNYSYLNLSHFDTGLQDWDSHDITTIMNPSTSFINSYHLEPYLSNSDIYIGLSGTNSRIGIVPMSNLTAIAPYNSAGSNDGAIRMDGGITTDVTFYFTGDGQNAPQANIRSNTYVKTWERPITTGDITILSGTDPALDFNVTMNNERVVNDPAYSFVVSAFGGTGSTAPVDKFYVYRKDLGTQLWDSVGPRIEPGVPTLNSSTFRMSLDDGGQHLAVQYSSQYTSYNNVIRVLNRKATLDPASIIPNGGLCLGHNNEIYPHLEYYDYDNDSVRILSLSSLGGNITNLVAVGAGVYTTGNPVISKFRIYGTFSSSVNDQIVIEYTDGWSTFYDTLPLIGTSASAPNVTFAQSPLFLCSNENLIDLTHYVSYYDKGVFTLNGYDLETPVLNGLTESVNNPSGTIYYEAFVDGCFVETGVSFSFVTAGTATGSATPADCGTTNGTAQVVFTPGTSSNVTVEWSTGETGTTIGDLAPGAYYYAVTDEFGCHTTGLANVDMNGISVTPSVTNVSCAGANDGSISVTVNGSSTYSVLWSNGYSTSTITDLAPGNYEVTVFDISGCHGTYSFAVTEPAAITAGFSTYDPDCGSANGNIYGVYNGGAGSYTFDWIGMGQTTADLYNVQHGYYQVEVTDVNGCADTFGFQLDDYQAVDIRDSIANASCFGNNGAIFITFTQDANGGTLANSVSWSNGSTFEDLFNLTAGSYTITAISGSPGQACYSSKTITVGTTAPATQEICVVTVDTATTNLVIWEKAELSGIDHYNIYRENATAGTFMLIDTVHFNSESLFNDVVASPLDRSWRYKISAVSTCGIESPVSRAHKTLHLNSILDQGNGTMDIYWDDYEGLTAAEYVVFRFTDQNNWEALGPPVPFGTSVFSDIPPAGVTGLDYLVEMQLSYQCTAEKAQDFNSSRSNKDKGQFNAGNGSGGSNNDLAELIHNGTVEVYPNPFSNLLTIRVTDATEPIAVSVYSIDGQLLQSGMVSNGTNELDLSALQPGTYFIQLGSAEHVKQLVKL